MQRDDVSYWDNHRNRISSGVGGWKIGESVRCREYDLLHELMGKHSYFQVMYYQANGKMIDERVARWVEACYLGLSYPDHRIWCNQMGTLAADLRASPAVAPAVGVLAADSIMYGSRIMVAGMKFIQAAVKKWQAGASVEEIIADEASKRGGKIAIVGYSRPITVGDERVPVMREISRQLGLEDGSHQQLAMRIDEVLSRDYGERINHGGLASAFCSDHGMTTEDAYRYALMCVTSGVLACYTDYVKRPRDSFLPMRCNDIDYQGVAPRELPQRFTRKQAGHDSA